MKADVGRLDRALKLKKLAPVIRVLQAVEPRLCGLSIGLAGGENIPLADIGVGRLVPLPLVGQGIYRLFEFAVAIVANEAGIVLIDEAENGLHYEALPTVWRGLQKLAEDSEVQVFATTHSWECMRAAYQAFQGRDPWDLAVYRLERHEDGRIRPIPFTRGAMEGTFASDLEVR